MKNGLNDMLSLILFLIMAVQSKHPAVYEISTRPWLYELSKKYSKSITRLRDIPLEEFNTLKNAGIDYVWMMGVWQLGPYGLSLDKQNDYSSVLPGYTEDDIIGSPYAITEYKCNSEIGSDDDLAWLKQQLNAKGMKLLLDFVPNHSACDAPTATSHPEYYVRAPKGQTSYDPKYYTSEGLAHGKDPYFDPWPDVIQWNYFEQKTRDFMKSNLLKTLSVSDGVRCDMAHLVLNDVFANTWNKELTSWGYTKPSTEFWQDAIKEAKKTYPNAIFLAEVYEDWEIQKLYELGFNYCYDKALLDKCEGSASDINNYIHYKTEDFFGHACHFVENHDENRAVYNMGSVPKADAAGTVAATVGGMIFMNHGQWSGLKNKLDVHLRRSADEPVSSTAQNHYRKLMQIVANDAFRSTNYYFVYNINGENANKFIAYIRKGTNSFLVVVNYSNGYVCANVPIYDISGSGDVKLYEMFSDTEYKRDAATCKSTGLTVCLDAYQSQIFKYNY